jgi:formylmethanofuran dehydrogenase subunit E
MSKLTAERVRELRACNNPVFDELLDFVQEMSDEYQAWITELDGPTPAELQQRITELERDLRAADAKRHLYELDKYDHRVPGAVSVGGTVRCSACGIAEEHGCPGPSRRWQNELVCEVVKLRDALSAALVELDNVAGWSGSSGNWPLHDAVTKARAALSEKP